MPTTAARGLGVEIRYDSPVDRAGVARRRPLRRGAHAAVNASPRAPAWSPAGGFESNLDVAARGLGTERTRRMAGRQLPDPRHALQPGRAAAHLLAPAPTAIGDPTQSTAWPSTRARRCTTAASARASTASRWASWSTATPSVSTTRAKTSGPSATPSGAGWSPSSRGRSATRSSMPRPSAASCRRCSPANRADTLDALAASSACPKRASCATVNDYNAACRVGQLRPRGARRLPHRGPDAGQDALGAADRHAAVLRLRAASGHHLHLPRREGRRAALRCISAGDRAATCSPPAK
jgi:hypothetical protein